MYKGIAIPLLWHLLDKRGNSGTAERIEITQRFIRQFGKLMLKVLLADREFVGSGEYAKHEKHRFYRMAKRSATECAASQKLGLIETEKLSATRDLLFRIVSMLIKLVSAAH